MSDDLKLLVEWSSPWEEFRSSIGPATARSPRALAGEAPVGIFPYKGILISWGGELLLLALIILLSKGYDSMHPYQTPAPSKYEVIYFSGEELPKVTDIGGAQAGKSGRGGGQEAHHPTQVIRVARGEIAREKVVDAPKLNLPHSDAAVANLLAYKPVPGPPPTEGMRSSLHAPSLAELAAIAPAANLERTELRAQPTLNTPVVPPAPSARDVVAVRLPGSTPMEIVPPPVSAPERATNLAPKLTLPAPTVVAPPPQLTNKIARGPGFGANELQRQVVPPAVQLGTETGERRQVAGLGTATVVPPPSEITASSLSRQAATGLSNGSAVVPPSPAITAGTSLTGRGTSSLGGGTAVVPPPPSVSEGSSLAGRGTGKQGGGFGGVGELGDLAAPPSGGGNTKGAGVVVSNQPGSKVGVPGNGGAGSLAMSPDGTGTTGLGGSGGGTSIGHGNGPGSGLAGAGPGAGKEGTGRGSDPSARGGISPFPGHGGTGNSATGNPAMPGVSVSGGSNNTNTGVVNLPSFSEGGSSPADPSHANTNPDKHGGITVVASSRSGGAFNFYGALKGDKVYTIYIGTSLGTAVMQFADPASAEHTSLRELTAPEPMRTDLPIIEHHARLIITCVLDRDGMVKNARVLDSASPVMSSKVLAALPNWKFRPAMRGEQPVEVNAFLGFDIDTNDRY